MRQQDDDRALFMISVAAELAGMHPQTLRLYERRGLVRPQRTAKNTRRYSQRDVERLQARLVEAAAAMHREIERVERSHRFELVPVSHTQIVPLGRRRRRA